MTCLCKQIAGDEIDLSSTCIGNLWIFQDLDIQEVKELSHKAYRKRLAKGSSLFFQGDPADEVLLIKGGLVKLTKVLEDGTELMLDIRKSGDFLGENMFSEKALFPVSAVCIEDTFICGFSRNQFEELILNHPKVGLQIIKTLSERISRLTDRVESLASSNIEERLYRVLSNVADEHGSSNPRGVVIQFPLTHEDLGFLTGAHRVTITRAIKGLKESGRIILEGKKIILPLLKSA